MRVVVRLFGGEGENSEIEGKRVNTSDPREREEHKKPRKIKKTRKKGNTNLGRRRKHHRHRQAPQRPLHQVHSRRLLPRVLALERAPDRALVGEDREALPALDARPQRLGRVAAEEDEVPGLGRAEGALAAPGGALDDEGAVLFFLFWFFRGGGGSEGDEKERG